MNALRESLRSGGLHPSSTQAAGAAGNAENRELVNSMRQMIVSNFQERMQLRRSLIELEDQNVQNSIEVSKRQLIVVQWTEHEGVDQNDLEGEDLGAHIIAKAPSDVGNAWRECGQLRKAVMKNNSMKRSIAKRLRHNEREAERVRDELGGKITGEDRRELMELQYQVGRLELENMELEQHRIVHESILKGKDLVIQKLKLQLAVKDKIVQRQQAVLSKHNLEGEVGYSALAVFEQSVSGLGDIEGSPQGSSSSNTSNMNMNAKLGTHTANAARGGMAGAFEAPSSPPRSMGALGVGTYVGGMPNQQQRHNNNNNNNNMPQQQQGNFNHNPHARHGGLDSSLDNSLNASLDDIEGPLSLDSGDESNSNIIGSDGAVRTSQSVMTALLPPASHAYGDISQINIQGQGGSLARGSGSGSGPARSNQRNSNGSNGSNININGKDKDKDDRERERGREREEKEKAAKSVEEAGVPSSHHFFMGDNQGSGKPMPMERQGAVITGVGTSRLVYALYALCLCLCIPPSMWAMFQGLALIH